MTQDHQKENVPLFKQAYPEELKKQEQSLLGLRCKSQGGSCRLPAKIGLALSGGGIRSATFAFGAIQGLAALEVFKKIDVLSTVSGGGYTGSLISRLFARREVASAEDVERAIQPADGEQDEKTWTRSAGVFRWLRENGQHLAPNGSGDLLLGGAIMLRNWLSVHVVLATLVLMVFVGMQLVRNGLHHFLSGKPIPAVLTCLAGEGPNDFGWLARLETRLTCNLPLGQSDLWWSPWLMLPLLIFVVLVVPCGWAYWLTADYGRKSPDRSWPVIHFPIFRMIVLLVILMVSLVVAWIAADIHFPALHSLLPENVADKAVEFICPSTFRTICAEGVTPLLGMAALILLVSGVFTFFIVLWSCLRFVWLCLQNDDGFRDDSGEGHWLSSKLKTMLLLFGVTLVLGVIDTLGQTAYVMWEDPAFSLGGWLVTLLGGLVPIAAGARQIAAYFPGGAGATRVRPSLNVAAMIAAALLFTMTLTAVNALSHGIAWGFKYPYHVPEKLVTRTVPTDITLDLTPACAAGSASCTDSDMLGRFPCEICAEPGERNLWLTAVVFVILVILSCLFGQTWPFLNNSTLLPLYTARLTRAYLGASNPRRAGPLPRRNKGGNEQFNECPPPIATTQAHKDDDMSIEKSWWSKDEPGIDPFKKGAPLHLVNVTINETLSGVSQVQRNDRRGVGMAVGPAGISAGIRHHVVFQNQEPVDPARGRPAFVYPKDDPESRVFRVFAYKSRSYGGDEWEVWYKRLFRIFAYRKRFYPWDEQQVWYKGSSLTLGQWTGISGAAFSTGLGSRTSLGLSLLAGFFNVRLGMWWDSGVKPSRRRTVVAKGSRRGERLLAWSFPVQSFLVGEFLARFPGVARRWWYLSDGGHFENTGAYELIRRRLPLIVIVDAGADPDYTYDDLANLIRKARLDFGAEVEFLDHDALRALRNAEKERNMASLVHFGSLEMLRRGSWGEEAVPSTGAEEQARRPVFGPPDRPRRSLAHAALAWVRYDNRTAPESLIVYIKPTLLGDEPLDITSYHLAHPNFPQQTTADQFFDEAQWESYRKLGQFITRRLFPDGFDSYFRMLEDQNS